MKKVIFIFIILSFFDCTNNESKIANHENQQAKKENPYKDQLKIIITRTGYFPSNVWKPCIELSIQNITNTTINDYVDLKVIFRDLDSGEILGEPATKIISGYQPLEAGATRSNSVFMPFLGIEGATNKMADKNVKAEIYIEDGFVEEIRIENKSFR